MHLHGAKRLGGRLLATTVVAAMLSALPLVPTTTTETGALTIGPAPALAKDGEENSGPAGASIGTPAAGGANGAPASGEREFRLSDGTRIEVVGDDIEVTYSDGWKEEIESGRYELKDPAGNTVVERRATSADRTRLEGQLPS